MSLVEFAITQFWHSRRPTLAARHKQDFSLFRLERDHLQRARTIDCFVSVGFTVAQAPPG
jgi:hypothetical protein